ncbi:restriction endonuclease subunit S [Kribbella sp. NPDC056345]|uniref:restriction endonuclease subunit S n=1 Tax=Kribbella sp. NPDC056345 TaxID=3345789 RepID=UPI0035DBCC72
MTWSERRVQEMADLINGFPFDSADFSDDADLPLVRIRDILGDSFETFVSSDVVPESAMIRNGDVLVGMDGDFNVVHWLRGTAALNQRLCLLRANGRADMRFLAYALPAHLQVINDLTYATTVKHLSSSQVRGIRMTAPDPEEQRAIADYLDRETARIDTLIDEQQRLIEMLGERRTAVVDATVWYGLDPEAAREATGIDPAPSAPAHWQRVRNKNLFFESSALSVNGEEELLTVSHLTGITPRSEKQNVNMTEAESLVGYRCVEAGDLVINTMWAWMGALGVSKISGIVSPAYGVYRPLAQVELEPRFFDYLYRSRPYIIEMTRHSRGIWESRLRLYPESFLRLHVVVPPVSEQRRIADHLDEQITKLDRLITEAERFVELARERRAALIAAAVTGQLDVREMT